MRTNCSGQLHVAGPRDRGRTTWCESLLSREVLKPNRVFRGWKCTMTPKAASGNSSARGAEWCKIMYAGRTVPPSLREKSLKADTDLRLALGRLHRSLSFFRRVAAGGPRRPLRARTRSSRPLRPGSPPLWLRAPGSGPHATLSTWMAGFRRAETEARPSPVLFPPNAGIFDEPSSPSQRSLPQAQTRSSLLAREDAAWHTKVHCALSRTAGAGAWLTSLTQLRRHTHIHLVSPFSASASDIGLRRTL